MKWTLIDSGAQTAKDNMELDAKMLDELDQHEHPILHFYDWKKPSATYGLLMNPSDFLSLESANKHGLELAKRPTGGGIIFHLWDYAFSVLVPASSSIYSENTLENYALVNNAVLKAVSEFFTPDHRFELIPNEVLAKDAYCERFCMAKPTKYDVVYEGKKIAGAAQRKTKKGFLHQGSIAVCMPDVDLLRQLLFKESYVLEAMLHYSFPISGSKAISLEELANVRLKLKDRLYNYITKDPR